MPVFPVWLNSILLVVVVVSVGYSYFYVSGQMGWLIGKKAPKKLFWGLIVMGAISVSVVMTQHR